MHLRPNSTHIKKYLLKFSGELFSSNSLETLSRTSLETIARTIQELKQNVPNCSIAIVVGGGNVVRGSEIATSCKFDRITSDFIGMHATIINCIALHHVLNQMGIISMALAPASLIGAQGGEISSTLNTYNCHSAKKYFEDGTVLILGGGTGTPFFTTDTAAILRGLELGAEIIVKATKVNGVYSNDPLKDPKAERYESIEYPQAIKQKLRIMDQTAFSLADEYNIPLFIYKYGEPHSLIEAMTNPKYGTFVVHNR